MERTIEPTSQPYHGTTEETNRRNHGTYNMTLTKQPSIQPASPLQRRLVFFLQPCFRPRLVAFSPALV